MKKLLIISAILVTVITSCKKDEPPAPSGGGGGNTSTYLISTDSGYVTGDPTQTQVRKFEYNSNKKLVRVKYKNGTSTTYDSYDTVYYNGSGQVSKVESFYTGVSAAYKTNIYNYVGGVLTSVDESGTNFNGPYVRTRNFTYTGGKISSQTVVYTTGIGDGSPEDISSITFTGNNISSADVVGIGPVTLTSETTAPNPYYGLNFDSEDILNNFNTNNILQVYATADPTTLFVNNTYTYSGGRVATITDNNSTPIFVTAVTYTAL